MDKTVSQRQSPRFWHDCEAMKRKNEKLLALFSEERIALCINGNVDDQRRRSEILEDEPRR